jgi:Domain of unknown function (DUF4157)
MVKYFPDLDLGYVQIHDGIPFYVPGDDKDGYTSKTDIYIRDGHYKPDSVIGLSLLGHELTHTRQYQQYCDIPFKLTYAGQAISNFGYGPDIPLEKEAYDNGRDILNDLNARRNNNEIPCGCEQTLTP